MLANSVSTVVTLVTESLLKKQKIKIWSKKSLGAAFIILGIYLCLAK
jgi:threonine/homoserine/homoserine lactone efflux protein